MDNKKLKILISAFACLKDPDNRFGFGEGGEGVLGWNLILQINRFCETYVLTHSFNRDVIEKKIGEENITGINFYYIDLKFPKKFIQIYAYLWQIKAYFIAKKLHKENNFSLFHHITYANDWMASFIGAFLSVPYLRGPGGGAQKVPENFLVNFSLKEKIKEKIRSLGQWIFRHDPIFIIGQNKSKAILICNNESHNAVPEKWKNKAILFSVNGISKKEVTYNFPKIENNNFQIVSAGKLIKIKGFDLALEAFKIFSDKFLNVNFEIIGDGPELKKLQKDILKYNIEDKVKIKKWMRREDLMKEINDSDVFLFLSLRDGGGAVVVEAMAMGKPVVCFDAGGPGFHIDEKTGFKIKLTTPSESVKNVADTLEKIYRDKDLKNRLGINAKEKAERLYLWDNIGEELLKIYTKILK
jgi:glycosyltransferase involved in cell wall biosynthesis